MDITEIRTKLERLQGQKIQIEKDISKSKKIIRNEGRELKKYEQAKEVIREVGIQTQKQLQYHISDITSLALESVFPKPYTLEVEFVQRRNKTECDIYFVRDGERVNPIEASGVGAIDVAAFALRIAGWSLNIPHSRNTIILDEPMKFVSEGFRDAASRMIKEVSQKLDIQFIIITHDTKLASYADKVFKVIIKDRVSNVTTI